MGVLPKSQRAVTGHLQQCPTIPRLTATTAAANFAANLAGLIEFGTILASTAEDGQDTL
jgi:hypothetical protein